MKAIKYILLCAVTIAFVSCNTDDEINTGNDPLPELTAGSVDFSNYVAIGASFTAGVSDNGLFRASQENSFPNTLSKAFANVGGGEFIQPLVDDNTGGILAGGTVARGYRLVFGGAAPVPLDAFLNSQGFPVPPITTEAGINIGSDFNNFGIPGAKSFDLITPGYAGANPYYARIASAPSATVLQDAMAKNPTFFTLSEIGGNDVLGYATSGGNGTNPITDPGTFSAALSDLVDGLTENGAKGAIGNVPNITSLSFFTFIEHNPVPLDAPTADLLNSLNAYGAYNAGISQAYAFLVANTPLTQAEADAEIAKRTITFSAGEGNSLVILDEDLRDLTGINPNLINLRQATSEDLITLTASTQIPNGVGVSSPLGDSFVLTPEEQEEIANATMAYNASIQAIAESKGLALVDLNSILEEAASTGLEFDSYTSNTDFVTGGLVSLDGIHLTAKGYALMANGFLRAIDATYGSTFEASGNLAKADDFPVFYSPALE
jgi:lysophospholipase L1-like esterase